MWALNMDKIIICDLPLQALIGIYAAEQDRRQRLILNLEIELDLSRASVSDALVDTVNYAEIEERLVRLGETSHYQLLEALAGAAAALVLEYEPVTSVRVRIEKPAAARFGRAIAVEINRTRERRLEK